MAAIQAYRILGSALIEGRLSGVNPDTSVHSTPVLVGDHPVSLRLGT